jgi:hypothetical protein
MAQKGYTRKAKTRELVIEEYDEDLDELWDDPEDGLLSALLFDGVQAYLSLCSAESKDELIRSEEAIEWVKEHNPNYAFSFNNVCGSLGIEPDALRLGLVNIMRSTGDRVADGL